LQAGAQVLAVCVQARDEAILKAKECGLGLAVVEVLREGSAHDIGGRGLLTFSFTRKLFDECM
jgi:hypothetical protein